MVREGKLGRPIDKMLFHYANFFNEIIRKKRFSLPFVKIVELERIRVDSHIHERTV